MYCLLKLACNIFSLQVFGDEADMYKLEDVQVQDFGEVGEVVITKDDTLFMRVCGFTWSLTPSFHSFLRKCTNF